MLIKVVGTEFNVSPVALKPLRSGAAATLPLGELLQGVADVPADFADLSISGVFDDSRRLIPGGLFVAVRGNDADGRSFIDNAVSRGAAAIVAEDLPPLPGVRTIPVQDARAALATLAARWHNLASLLQSGFDLIGITGTNGKSTAAYMTRSMLSAAGRRCGLLGTIAYDDLGGVPVPAKLTTPGALELTDYVQRCAANGGDCLVLETSSHALDQKRTDGLRFSVAAFTNLTGDHLDYHKTMEAYADAKARLFERLPADGTAVVNRDDPHAARMVRDCKARILYYSLQQDADLTARVTREQIDGTHYKLKIAGQTIAVDNKLVGRHNVYNALAAAGIAHALGIATETIAAGLRQLRNVPGRLERVVCELPGVVFVDYAHTDDALTNVLSVLKPLAQRRLMVVFGCGGDRDRSKRPRMAAVAARYADAIIVTSDNPRSENPHAIIDEVLSGFAVDARRRVMVEPDRRAAIFGAISSMHAGDVLLIAGKGHENYQVIGHERLPFDDVQEVQHAARACMPAEALA